jgi:hypothetical protein
LKETSQIANSKKAVKEFTELHTGAYYCHNRGPRPAVLEIY